MSFFHYKGLRYSHKGITYLFQMACWLPTFFSVFPNIKLNSILWAKFSFLLPFLAVLVFTDVKYLFGLKHFRKYISHSSSVHWSWSFTMLPKVVTTKYWPWELLKCPNAQEFQKNIKANYKSLPAEKGGFLYNFCSIILKIIPEEGLEKYPRPPSPPRQGQLCTLDLTS